MHAHIQTQLYIIFVVHQGNLVICHRYSCPSVLPRVLSMHSRCSTSDSHANPRKMSFMSICSTYQGTSDPGFLFWSYLSPSLSVLPQNALFPPQHCSTVAQPSEESIKVEADAELTSLPSQQSWVCDGIKSHNGDLQACSAMHTGIKLIL